MMISHKSRRGDRPHAPSKPGSWRRAHGQSVVEFALAAPVFFILLFGTLDVGMIFKTRVAYQQATQEAVRVAAAAGQDGTADTQALNELQIMLPVENLSNIADVMIFNANSGAPSNAADVYKYDSSSHSFVPDTSSTYSGWSWPPSSRSVKATAPDHIGVKVIYSYQSILGLLPPLQMTETATAVMEPSDYGP